MFEKKVKSIKMVIITGENLEITGSYDIWEYEDGEIKYFDDFGREITPNENLISVE